VLVGSLCQLLAATQAATLENCAPISRGHALPETMHAHATADFWLIRTFRHSSFLTLKILLLVLISKLELALYFASKKAPV
jgi:hypothetical protein